MKLGWRECLGYGAGDMACNLVFQTATLYLMYFYTDVYGISAAAAASLLLMARVIDGAWDVAVGLWIDRARSRWGRCRPFLLWGAPLLSVLAVATYHVPDTDMHGKLVWAGCTYVALMMAYSLVNIPYGAMPAVMTGDADQRTRLQSIRMAFAVGGSLIVSGLTLPLVKYLGGGNEAQGYLQTVALFSVAGLVLLWICFASVREHVPAVTGARQGLREDVLATLGSRAWRRLALALLCLFAAVLMPANAAMYFFRYVVERPELAAVYFVCANLGSFGGVAISYTLGRSMCKRTLVCVLGGANACFYLLYLVIDLHSDVQIVGLAMLLSAVSHAISPLLFSMLADTSDSIELGTGRRVVGLSSSAVSLAAKVGMGVGSAVAGGVLTYFGYQAGGKQTPEAVQGILLCMSAGPSLTMVCFVLLMAGYPLHRRALQKQQAALQQLRSSAAQAEPT